MGENQSKVGSEAEICPEFLVSGVCKTQATTCSKVHRRKPYWWQIRRTEDRKWFDLVEEDTDKVESAYCVPKNDRLSLPLRAPTPKDAEFSTWFDGSSWTVDFLDMVATPAGRNGFGKLIVRRVATPSTGAPYETFEPTTYRWYFTDIFNNWVEYGAVSTLMKGLPQFETRSNIDSGVIEKHYCSEENRVPVVNVDCGDAGDTFTIKPMPFKTEQHSYNIDFNRMVQINLDPKLKTERRIRRRPVYRACSELPSVSASRQSTVAAPSQAPAPLPPPPRPVHESRSEAALSNAMKRLSSPSPAAAAGPSSHAPKPLEPVASESTLDLRKLMDGKRGPTPKDGKPLNEFEKWQLEHERKRQARLAELLAKGKEKPSKNDPELMATKFALIDVSPLTPEFQELHAVIKEGSKTKLFDRLKSIRRVENSVLKARFEAEKRRMAQKHGADSGWARERRLFHGTKDDRAESICRINFDLDVAGTATGALYGRGVYLASTATSATLYGTCILVCRTLPGRWYSGTTHEDWREPPLVPGSATRYDSVADSSSRPNVHIIFDENKIYPEYIVKL